MASWPDSTRVIGAAVPRLDGLAKASGRAKYPSDERPDGVLFAAILHSPHAHAKITKIDTSKAEAIPGVKAVHLIAEEGATVRYHGEEIAAVAAESEEIARDGCRAIAIEFEVLPHAVTEEQALSDNAPRLTPRGNTQEGRAQQDGDPDAALAEAAATVEGHYSLPVITHVCLETHGQVVRWDGPDRMTVWASTQNVDGVESEMAGAFEIPATNVTVLTPVMGGGFGSKFGADTWGVAAGQLAKKTGRPVWLFLDRIQEHLTAGNRPSASAKIKIGADKSGKITAMIAETQGTGGISRGAAFPLPYVYEVPNSRRQHTDVRINGGNARAMRAPGHPQGCAMMEFAVDDLAEALGMDPLQVRLNSLAEQDTVPSGDGQPINRSEIYRAQIELGRKAIGWDQRKSRAENAKAQGPLKRGFGMALHQWGGGGRDDKQVTCIINPDGSVELRSATQDIGTGCRTILAQIAAEVLGLEPTAISSNIGNSQFPPGQASGGSTTTPSMAPPAYNAALKAREQLFRRIAGALDAEPGDLEARGGVILVKGEREVPWKEACRKLGTMPVSVTEGFLEGLTAQGVGGCQFVDLTVDVETGVVRLNKIVAVQDTGLILNMLTWKSQVYGGVIMGLNYGLFEELVMDPTTGLALNPDMELYKLAGASDIPEIEIIPFDNEQMRKRGVIGVGEPPTIATAAAIGNAVANALGTRVPAFPMSPWNVLNALAKA
ncbi:xanthine dehydrogenase family protein molybdopterin-binding subunit [Tautonia sociabilis]|uniref:Xanthine dehydrogenase family protein molybdopterin-binding subunit n=1 Tax=Tautonia sociabilis TaxID=2080755 RepID=A0A432MK82_9BACT|nr:xanthine dehydrogenase family protein molybdopterin-binding subunit [Tautonia sociabilis]RUL87824.1 xanthine dehydrogenase family protein molybdopterin-binding subunit [Tautonia sociabilis]